MFSLNHSMYGWVRIEDDTHVSFSSQGGGSGGEVCHLRLHLVCVRQR